MREDTSDHSFLWFVWVGNKCPECALFNTHSSLERTIFYMRNSIYYYNSKTWSHKSDQKGSHYYHSLSCCSFKKYGIIPVRQYFPYPPFVLPSLYRVIKCGTGIIICMSRKKYPFLRNMGFFFASWLLPGLQLTIVSPIQMEF